MNRDTPTPHSNIRCYTTNPNDTRPRRKALRAVTQFIGAGTYLHSRPTPNAKYSGRDSSRKWKAGLVFLVERLVDSHPAEIFAIPRLE